MKKHVWFLLAGVLLSVCSRAENISGQNTPPRFPDGDFTRWVYDRTEFPAVALKDRTTGPATFLISISKEGKISRCRTRQYPHAAIRDALLETIRSSPEWMPATRDGIPCEGSVEIVLDLTPKIDPQKRPDMISVTTLAEPLFPRTSTVQITSQSVPNFIRWIGDNFRSPIPKKDKNIHPCRIAFVVRANGSVTDVNISECDDPRLSAELKRVVETSPDWAPALVNKKEHDYTMCINGLFRPGKKKYGFYLSENIPPEFKEGDLKTFRTWVMDRIQYPTACAIRNIEGEVTVSFVVETDGSIGQITPIKSPHKLLTQEVVRVLKLSPKWKPGMVNGEIAPAELSISFNFKNRP